MFFFDLHTKSDFTKGIVIKLNHGMLFNAVIEIIIPDLSAIDLTAAKETFEKIFKSAEKHSHESTYFIVPNKYEL